MDMKQMVLYRVQLSKVTDHVTRQPRSTDSWLWEAGPCVQSFFWGSLTERTWSFAWRDQLGLMAWCLSLLSVSLWWWTLDFGMAWCSGKRTWFSVLSDLKHSVLFSRLRLVTWARWYIAECHNIDHGDYLSEKLWLEVSEAPWTLLPEQALMKPGGANVRGLRPGIRSHVGGAAPDRWTKGGGASPQEAGCIGLLFIGNTWRREDNKWITFPPPTFLLSFLECVLVSFVFALSFDGS